MVANLATEIAGKFTDGVKEHNVQPALDELNHDKSTMSAKQYAALLQGVTKEVDKSLPGVTFTDSNVTGAVALQARDNYGMSLPITGDAAGAASLAKVTADAQMPTAEAFVASKMDGATITAQQPDQNFYKTKDGGTAIVAKVDSETRYHFFGANGDSVASISSDPKDPHASYVNLGKTGYESHPATATTKHYDVLFGKNMDSPTKMLVKDPETGAVSEQKISHVKKDLEVAAIATGIVATAGAAEYSQVKIDESHAPVIGKVVDTVIVDDAGASLIGGLASKAPGAIQRPAAPLKDVPAQGSVSQPGATN